MLSLLPRIALGLFILLLTSISLPLRAQLQISLESGLVFNQYNEVRVPNGAGESGTLFSLRDDFGVVPPAAFLRVEAAYTFRAKHTVEIVAAPLQLNYRELLRADVAFAGEVFSGAAVDGRYRFNTYRAAYRYRLVDRPRLRFDLGVSVLIRDARIALREGSREAEDTDLGAVPLLSFDLQYAPGERWRILLKGDALVGPQGRAEDIFAGLRLKILRERLWLKAGYRLIEGGADVDQVYNFAFFHFADIGVIYEL